MLQTLVITLREGVEASLVIAIAIAYLKKIGRADLLPSVYRAFVAAVIASFAAAWALSRIPHSDEAYEGWTLLVSAVFVLSMVVWMNRHARGLKGEIETQLQNKSSSEASRWGIFFFVFLMVFREGVETVLMLGAVTLNSSGIFELLGIAIGLALAILFGVSFVRGTIRVNLKSFFKMTTVILMVVVAQLIITGLHELSEGQILPGSAGEMALIGPIVRNEVFFFVAILSLAGAMLLMEWRNRRSAALPGLEGAALRRAKWSARREKLWMTASCAASGIFILAITAEFIYAKQSSGLSPATPIEVSGGEARIPVSEVSDGNLHRFAVVSEGVTVRIIVIERPDKTLATAFDACEICGNQGYYQKGLNVICRNCASAIFIPSIGVHGGCNPIPLESKVENGQLILPAAKLFAGVRLFRNTPRNVPSNASR
ncbi:MAG: Fe-S-containing protein [Acidobacteriota bacterium]|nr:Fe-S-containing protein [Acidobacteriota bacterium]